MVVACAVLVGCGDDAGDGATSGSTEETSSATGQLSTSSVSTSGSEATGEDKGSGASGGGPASPDPGGKAGHEVGPGGGDNAGAGDAEQKAAADDALAAYQSYISAMDSRDGAALCDLLSPAGVRELRPPVSRASCSATLHDSIGYSDPRGFPVWKRTTLGEIDGVQVSGDLASARITALITTEFADRDQPSIEDDIAYLELSGGEWRLAKPSGALYRAVGNAELPPSVIVPPKG